MAPLDPGFQKVQGVEGILLHLVTHPRRQVAPGVFSRDKLFCGERWGGTRRYDLGGGDKGAFLVKENGFGEFKRLKAPRSRDRGMMPPRAGCAW
jgi:hypothetical protein